MVIVAAVHLIAAYSDASIQCSLFKCRMLVSKNQAEVAMMAPWIFVPRMSSADWMRDLMNMEEPWE